MVAKWLKVHFSTLYLGTNKLKATVLAKLRQRRDKKMSDLTLALVETPKVRF